VKRVKETMARYQPVAEELPLGGGRARSSWLQRNAGTITAVTGTASAALFISVAALTAELHATKSNVELFKPASVSMGVASHGHSNFFKQYKPEDSPSGVDASSTGSGVYEVQPWTSYSSTIMPTGVGADGTALAAGEEDAHWFSATGSPLTVMSANTAWSTPEGSMFVNPHGVSSGDVNQDATSEVIVTYFETVSDKSTIELVYAADDKLSHIELNGLTDMDCLTGRYGIANTCYLNSGNGLLAGQNILKIAYINTGLNPSPAGAAIFAREITNQISPSPSSSGLAEWDLTIPAEEGGIEKHWTDMKHPTQDVSIVHPQDSWYNDENTNAMWIGPDTRHLALNANDGFQYTHNFRLTGKTQNINMKVAVAGMVNGMTVNGRPKEFFHAGADTAKDLTITGEDGLRKGVNSVSFHWTPESKKAGAIYLDVLDLKPGSVLDMITVPGGDMDQQQVYEYTCTFGTANGYNNGCSACLDNDMVKSFMWMQDDLNFALENCEAKYQLQLQYLNCDQSDATQFLADCKQYMTSVSNSMYACGAEGSLGGIPQWTPACNIDC